MSMDLYGFSGPHPSPFKNICHEAMVMLMLTYYLWSLETSSSISGPHPGPLKYIDLSCGNGYIAIAYSYAYLLLMESRDIIQYE